jgi:hypothetical protein
MQRLEAYQASSARGVHRNYCIETEKILAEKDSAFQRHKMGEEYAFEDPIQRVVGEVGEAQQGSNHLTKQEQK